MIGAGLKLIIFTSVVNRIINISRNERVTQQVYDTYLQMLDVCTLRHTAHIEAIVQFLPYSAQKVRCDGLHSRGNCSSNQAYSRVVVVQTLCTSRNPKGSSHKGLNRGTVQATSVTCTWFEEQNYRGCGDHHTWHVEQSMAGNGLSPRCVPCDEGCIHRTFVGMCHKLVELLFHFYDYL